MSPISTLRRSQAALTRWRPSLQPSSIPFDHELRRLRAPNDYNDGDERHRTPGLAPRRCISTSSALPSSRHSFHGIPLPGADEEKTKTRSADVQEAEIVVSEEERFATRELMKEVALAEMSAHSTVPRDAKDDGELSTEKESKALGSYEKMYRQLKQATRRHENIDPTTLAYTKSIMDMGELHYKLGGMDQSQELYKEALRDLLHGNEDGVDSGRGGSSRVQMMIAQCMHALGAVHARCGEYDEVSRWYEESLKRKRQFSEDVIDGAGDEDSSLDVISHRYELGKTYNGMAVLEVIRGGDVRWEKAMRLFEEAEASFLPDCKQEKAQGQDGKDCGENEFAFAAAASSPPRISKLVIRQMDPVSVESLIDVRSNMGELLRQHGKFDEAIEMVRSALEVARIALENENEMVAPESSVETDGPGQHELRNAIVELVVELADNLASAERFDEAAEAYEEALSSHVHFRRWSEDDGGDAAGPRSRNNALPESVIASTKVRFDPDAATTIEAAIRNNLAHALQNIGQGRLALEHHEASLTIQRRAGGDNHVEVARTLDVIGALRAGPLGDLVGGLHCFKEALFIYRKNLEGLTVGAGGGSGDWDSLLVVDHREEIDALIRNAVKNIGLIEAALLNDGHGRSRQKRR